MCEREGGLLSPPDLREVDQVYDLRPQRYLFTTTKRERPHSYGEPLAGPCLTVAAGRLWTRERGMCSGRGVSFATREIEVCV